MYGGGCSISFVSNKSVVLRGGGQRRFRFASSLSRVHRGVLACRIAFWAAMSTCAFERRPSRFAVAAAAAEEGTVVPIAVALAGVVVALVGVGGMALVGASVGSTRGEEDMGRSSMLKTRRPPGSRSTCQESREDGEADGEGEEEEVVVEAEGLREAGGAGSAGIGNKAACGGAATVTAPAAVVAAAVAAVFATFAFDAASSALPMPPVRGRLVAAVSPPRARASPMPLLLVRTSAGLEEAAKRSASVRREVEGEAGQEVRLAAGPAAEEPNVNVVVVVVAAAAGVEDEPMPPVAGEPMIGDASGMKC